MLNPMNSRQRKAAFLAVPALALAAVGFGTEAIPVIATLAAFAVGTVFWLIAMNLK